MFKIYRVLKYIKYKIKKILVVLRSPKKNLINFIYEFYPLENINPDISVIVTSYNYDKFIKDTLDSLVNQTIKINNIIVIDDGSIDNSVDIIKNYAKRYDNIMFLQHPDFKNHGLASSVRYALSFSKNKWIAFCESDDLWDKRHIEFLVKKIKQCNIDGVYANKIKLYNNFDKEIYSDYLNSSDIILTERDGVNIYDYMKKSNILPTFSAVCVPKYILEKCDFNSYIPQYLDYWLWRQISRKYNIFYAKKSITFWRKHEDSWDRRDNIADISKFLENNDKIVVKF